MPLDTFVAQIAFRARLLERAVHDVGPWTIRFESGPYVMEMPATREFLDDGVAFHADFPPLIQMQGWFHLCWRGEQVSSRIMETHDAPFAVNWSIQGLMGADQRSA